MTNPEERAQLKEAVRQALGRSDLLKHRDWCDYRMDVMKGCWSCRPCDCPQDNDTRNPASRCSDAPGRACCLGGPDA